jgi:hypothetical protein
VPLSVELYVFGVLAVVGMLGKVVHVLLLMLVYLVVTVVVGASQSLSVVAMRALTMAIAM